LHELTVFRKTFYFNGWLRYAPANPHELAAGVARTLLSAAPGVDSIFEPLVALGALGKLRLRKFGKEIHQRHENIRATAKI
jgi:hypothetical protein